MSNKVLIMAGGTGGHIFPALAIAKELTNQGANIEWLGGRNSMEAHWYQNMAIGFIVYTLVA